MMMSGWGNYPKIDGESHAFRSITQLPETLATQAPLIAFGNGRSYGDAALAPQVVKCRPHNYFLSFSEKEGLLEVQSGVLLSEIIKAFAPRGWFPKVTPGTKHITLGGAIAADVHGKNHHVEGCFSESVKSFRLMLPDGSIKTCSPKRNKKLFHATCGGMGLTGIILDVKIYLKAIQSNSIEQTTIKTANLAETFAAFEEFAHAPYSVAWIDCLAKGSALGRCLLNIGDFADDHVFDYQDKKHLNVPFNFPGFALNKLSVKAFNWLYYHRVREKISQQRVSIDSFFYPLDAIDHWNRIYGAKGFTQYQCILPKEQSYEGLDAILKTISQSGKGSFLAVLKLYGKENDNYLSFPLEGYSLALDFKIEAGLFELLEQLDKIVVQYGGRIYLAKDARMSKDTFAAGYPKAEEFKKLRDELDLKTTFSSLQSQRLGI